MTADDEALPPSAIVDRHLDEIIERASRRRRTVTIDDTTLIVADIFAWRVETLRPFGEKDPVVRTHVHMRGMTGHHTFTLKGNHHSVLLAALEATL